MNFWTLSLTNIKTEAAAMAPMLPKILKNIIQPSIFYTFELLNI